MALWEFLREYFVEPIVNPAYQGYNAVNTLVYGAILLAIAFFVVFPFLDRKGIKFDLPFAFSLLPFILFGTTLRALTAASTAGKTVLPFLVKTANPLEPGFWTFTPGVWFLTFGVTISFLFLSRALAKRLKADYHKIFAFLGLIASAPALVLNFFNFSNWTGFFAVIVLVAIISGLVVFLFNYVFKIKLLRNGLNVMAMSGQAIDGTATLVAIGFYGFSEMHPLSAAILSMNPLLFVVLKISAVLAILYYVEKTIKSENLKGFTKVFLMILGFSTGTASVLKIGLLTGMG